MGFGAWWHWVLLLGVALVLFGGKGKVSDLMGDVAKGIKSFKKGLADDEDETETASAQDTKVIEQAVDAPVKRQAKKAKG